MGLFRRRRAQVETVQFYVDPHRAVGAGSAGNDLTNYRERLPLRTDNYMTFWAGNQLPSSYIYQPAPVYLIRQTAQMSHARTGGSFGQQLSRPDAESLVRQMKLAWRVAAGNARLAGR